MKMMDPEDWHREQQLKRQKDFNEFQEGFISELAKIRKEKEMSEKVDFDALRAACQGMIDIIEQIQNPQKDSSGLRNFGFPKAADRIRFELDGDVYKEALEAQRRENKSHANCLEMLQKYSERLDRPVKKD